MEKVLFKGWILHSQKSLWCYLIQEIPWTGRSCTSDWWFPCKRMCTARSDRYRQKIRCNPWRCRNRYRKRLSEWWSEDPWYGCKTGISCNCGFHDWWFFDFPWM